MKKRLALIAGLLLVGIVASFLWYQRADAPAHGGSTVTLVPPAGEGVTVAVEVADDGAERAVGLMNRTSLPDGTGMLFMYESAGKLGFWMKNTLIPLDILFFDENGGFVSRTTMDPCTADPCTTYESGGDARYALEVNRGEQLTTDVGPGWMLKWNGEN